MKIGCIDDSGEKWNFTGNIDFVKIYDYPIVTDQPSFQPSSNPSDQPSEQPSKSSNPSSEPSKQPTLEHSDAPSKSINPSDQPSDQPSVQPSFQPSEQPTLKHSGVPTESINPSDQPSDKPSVQPSFQPSEQPTLKHSDAPSKSSNPSDQPSDEPSVQPSEQPSKQPTAKHSDAPSKSSNPSDQPSIQPSLPPSYEPSDKPSSNPTKVPTPSPTSLSSQAPTDSSVPFDYGIAQKSGDEFAELIFSDEQDTNDFKFSYVVATKPTIARILDHETCLQEVTNNKEAIQITNSLTSKGVIDRSLLSDLDIDVSIDKSKLDGSSYFTSSGTDAIIKFCIRMDLVMDMDDNGQYDVDTESVNFYESKIEITVDMSKDFQITGIDTDRDSATVSNADANVSYYVDAYHCDNNGNKVSTILKQGDALEVCVSTNGTNVDITDITSMTLKQEGTTDYKAIDDGTKSPLTLRNCANDIANVDCYVKVMIISEFFTNEDPGDITVDGTVVFGFKSSRRLSSIRRRSGDARSLQQETSRSDDEGEFSMRVGVEGANGLIGPADESSIDDMYIATDSSAPASSVATVLSIATATVVTFLMM